MKAILDLKENSDIKLSKSSMSTVKKQPCLIGMFCNEYEALHDSIPKDAEPETCTKNQNLFACVTTLHHGVIFENESILIIWNRVKKYYRLSMSERFLIDMFCHISQTSKFHESIQMLYDVTIYYIYYNKSFEWFKNSVYTIIDFNNNTES